LKIQILRQPIDLSAISTEGGAYLLWLELDQPANLAAKSLKDGLVLPRGRYAYAGSAFGPGGLRARVGRHLRRNKTQRWHVDCITLNDTVRQIWTVPGGSECSLISHVLTLPGSGLPVPGFGSSDCRNCRSHLAEVTQTFEEANEFARP